MSVAGFDDFRDCAAWQRAEELRELVEEFLARPGVWTNFSSAAQLSDAASSAPRNIAEGFGRYRPRENAQFVRIAKGSETEVLNILIVARKKRFLSVDEFKQYETAARRAIGTAVGYIRYLEKAKPPE